MRIESRFLDSLRRRHTLLRLRTNRLAAVRPRYISVSCRGSSGDGVSRKQADNAGRGWRWCSYLNLILSEPHTTSSRSLRIRTFGSDCFAYGLSTLLYLFFYHPHNFDQLHKRRSKLQELKDLDFDGIVLLCAGFSLVLMRISWVSHLPVPSHSKVSLIDRKSLSGSQCRAAVSTHGIRLMSSARWSSASCFAWPSFSTVSLTKPCPRELAAD